MEEEMYFYFVSPVTIEETVKEQGKAIIKGTLIKEGVSRNGVLYTIEELENIAKTAQGVPIKFGTTTRIDPNTGLPAKNMHDISPEATVGRIIKTWVDKAKRAVYFIAEVFNTPRFPDLIKKLKKGWGISIGGIAKAGKWILDKLGRLVLKVFGVRINHVQLLPPKTPRGVKEAKVEEVEVQESMKLINVPPVESIEYELEISGEGISGLDIEF